MKRKSKKKLKIILLLILGVIGLSYLINSIDVDIGQSIITTDSITTTENNNIQLLLDIKTKVERANVYLQVNYQDGYEYGSGTVIHEDNNYYYAITNEHVIDANNNVINTYQVTTYNGVTSSFEIIDASEEKDLAIVKFNKLDRELIEPLVISENQSSINDIVVSIGNPGGSIGSITYGSIISITELKELELTHQVIEHNALLDNGSSGGALVDINGNLIGINTWRLNDNYYAIISSIIINYLINKI